MSTLDFLVQLNSRTDAWLSSISRPEFFAPSKRGFCYTGTGSSVQSSSLSSDFEEKSTHFKPEPEGYPESVSEQCKITSILAAATALHTTIW